jgi:hypothetical protein
MKIVRSFNAPISEATACERIVAFLTKAGFKRLPDANGRLHFKRGSIIGTLSSFNPTKWASSINILVTFGAGMSKIHVVTQITHDPLEKRFAEELSAAEFNLLETTVTTSEIKAFDVSNLRKNIASHVYRIVGLFAGFMLSIILGIIIGMFTFTRFNVSTFAASAIGAGVFLAVTTICLIVWNRQKKN